LPDGQAPNSNPQIAMLQLDGTEWTAEAPRSLVYGSCPSSDLAGVTDPTTGRSVNVCEHSITPVVDEAQSESYQTPLGDGTLRSQRERLRFAWFTDGGGSYSRETTSQPAPGQPTPPDGLTTMWREPTHVVSPINVWVVVRDGRGGTSWAQRQIVFE
jgi:hypothetical protein